MTSAERKAQDNALECLDYFCAACAMLADDEQCDFSVIALGFVRSGVGPDITWDANDPRKALVRS